MSQTFTFRVAGQMPLQITRYAGPARADGGNRTRFDVTGSAGRRCADLTWEQMEELVYRLSLGTQTIATVFGSFEEDD